MKLSSRWHTNTLIQSNTLSIPRKGMEKEGSGCRQTSLGFLIEPQNLEQLRVGAMSTQVHTARPVWHARSTIFNQWLTSHHSEPTLTYGWASAFKIKFASHAVFCLQKNPQPKEGSKDIHPTNKHHDVRVLSLLICLSGIICLCNGGTPLPDWLGMGKQRNELAHCAQQSPNSDWKRFWITASAKGELP